MSDFDAYRIFDEDGKIEGRLVTVTLDDLSEGEVVIETAYSSVNYKDALAVAGTARIVRRFPLTGGIDLAGSVVSSESPLFEKGDQVVVTGYELSVTHDGGYAGFARVPAEWVVRVPDGLSAFDTMAIGTAGFTAALCIVQMESNGLSPEGGPVIVTGATGGVGSVAVELLATGLPDAFATLLAGEARGRTVVKLN
jgi:NADPH2:quinone reductase